MKDLVNVSCGDNYTMIANSILGNNNCQESNMMVDNGTKTAQNTDQKENIDRDRSSEVLPDKPCPDAVVNGDSMSDLEPSNRLIDPSDILCRQDDQANSSGSEDEEEKLVINESSGPPCDRTESLELPSSRDETHKLNDIPTSMNGDLECQSLPVRSSPRPMSPAVKRTAEETETSPIESSAKKPKIEEENKSTREQKPSNDVEDSTSLETRTINDGVNTPTSNSHLTIPPPTSSSSTATNTVGTDNNLVEATSHPRDLKDKVNGHERAESLPRLETREKKSDVDDKEMGAVAEVRKSPGLTILQINENLESLKKDLCALELLLMQKEEEWNSLLHLTKKKEELYLKLLRKRQVMRLGGSVGKEKRTDEPISEADSIDFGEYAEQDPIMFLPQGVYSSLGTSHFPMAMVKHVLEDDSLPQTQVIPISKTNQKDSQSVPSSVNSSADARQSVSVIDIHTKSGNDNKQSSSSSRSTNSDIPQVTISPEINHSKFGHKQLNSSTSVKPILPKPYHPNSRPYDPPSATNYPGVSSPTSMPTNSPLPPTGFGPQGPTVSIHHLIAAHRKDNPNSAPIRSGKRGSWRYRMPPSRDPGVTSSYPDVDAQAYRHSPGGSYPPKTSQQPPYGSPVAAPNGALPITDPSVSYKDVLLQFAQLTQTEKHPGSPQISIIPVNSMDPKPRKTEPIPDSTSITREIPGSSQNLQMSQSLESSSALAKLLMESGAGGGNGPLGKVPGMEMGSLDTANPHCLTLSALLSGGGAAAANQPKDKTNAPLAGGIHSQLLQMEPKKTGGGTGSSEEDSPTCQGCHRSRAQFVCAGCGNQWYCSRHCQVTAWEKHSEHCNN